MMVETERRALGGNSRLTNNFNLLRLVAASMVVVSHGFGLRHPPGFYNENSILNSQGIGWAAVNVFFVMSGYLIARAVERNPDPRLFVRNRLLRIYPGLIVCTLVSVAALGLIFHPGDLVRYVEQGSTVRFAIGNISGLFPQYFLPGVFETNAFPGAVNGSLWSLRFEIVCYAIVAVLLAGGVLKRPGLRVLAFGALLAFYIGGAVLAALGHFPHSSTLHDLHRLSICFGLGMLYAHPSANFRVRLWHLGVASVVFAISNAFSIPALQAAAGTIALALATFWFAFLQHPLLTRFRTAPDWSYGVYIYAFPIQQLLMRFLPGLHPAVHCLAAFGLVLIPAALSWHFIERPALALKDATLNRPPRRDAAMEPASTAGALEASADMNLLSREA